MIQNVEYIDWSAKFHKDHSSEPIVMQMELTYRCPIHCLHCYSDCYNNADFAKKELNTDDIKKIMDKVYDAGCLWFTFTGGDPMTRPDFIELYDYAKDKGFIFSIMTSLVSLTDGILARMAEKPPFSINMTLNGVTEATYEKISQVGGSFKKVMANIDKALEAKLSLKIKTLISKNNLHEIDMIRGFVERKGLTFSASSLIFARLNQDPAPCEYRLSPEESIKLNYGDSTARECEKGEGRDIGIEPPENRFYKCAIGNWQWDIDSSGRLNICSCVREPSYDILSGDVLKGVKTLSDYVKNKRFSKNFECRSCRIWHICHWCPGKAKLELGLEEKPIPYFCELAKKEAEKLKEYD